MRSIRHLAVAVTVLLLGACSFSTGTSPAEAGVGLITGELADQSGLTYDDPTCSDPDSDDVGATFTCTATAGGDAVTFMGVLEDDDMIFLAPSNIIDASEMSVVEAEAAEVLGTEIGVEIDPSAVDCPDETTVLVDDQMHCVITDESNGQRFQMTLTATGFELREGYASRFYEIGDELPE